MMESELSFSEKYNEILTSERGLAQVVAQKVIDKPVLGLWMILIPVFFVFYYFQFNRYKNGLRDFKSNYLITRTRVLDALSEELEGGDKVDVDKLVAVSDSPPESKEMYREWIMTLIDHYRLLMQAEGGNFAELVRKGYKKRSNYLLSLNKINSSEREFNKILVEFMPGDKTEFASVVKRMEESAEQYRRELAKEIFA